MNGRTVECIADMMWFPLHDLADTVENDLLFFMTLVLSC